MKHRQSPAGIVHILSAVATLLPSDAFIRKLVLIFQQLN
jgi:hypothetical protein